MRQWARSRASLEPCVGPSLFAKGSDLLLDEGMGTSSHIFSFNPSFGAKSVDKQTRKS